MGVQRTSASAAAIACVCLMVEVGGSAEDAPSGPPLEGAGADAIGPPAHRTRDWPLVHIHHDLVARHAVIAALDAASIRLADEQCQRILDDFERFTSGRLKERLSALSVSIEHYPSRLGFVDGSRHRACRSGVLAFTAPGSRVVGVCVGELKRTWTENREHVIAGMIHEVLHTLGLGENPPSSHEITRRVLARCGRRTDSHRRASNLPFQPSANPAQPPGDAPRIGLPVRLPFVVVGLPGTLLIGERAAPQR
jgi:hypothetical protein